MYFYFACYIFLIFLVPVIYYICLEKKMYTPYNSKRVVSQQVNRKQGKGLKESALSPPPSCLFYLLITSGPLWLISKRH